MGIYGPDPETDRIRAAERKKRDAKMMRDSWATYTGPREGGSPAQNRMYLGDLEDRLAPGEVDLASEMPVLEWVIMKLLSDVKPPIVVSDQFSPKWLRVAEAIDVQHPDGTRTLLPKGSRLQPYYHMIEKGKLVVDLVPDHVKAETDDARYLLHVRKAIANKNGYAWVALLEGYERDDALAGIRAALIEMRWR